MKKILFSNKTTKSASDLTGFLLRIVFAVLMLFNHGWPKLTKMEELSTKFMSFMGMSPATSLSLAIFAEFFCSFLLIIGLFTRLATIPLIITMLVAIHSNGWQIIGPGNAELAMLFLTGFVIILILGPGKYSIDNMIYKNKR